MALRAKFLQKYIFGILILCTSRSFCELSTPYPKMEERKAIKELIQNYIDEMDPKYGLYCMGDGGRSSEKIETLSIGLITYRRASLTEAREITVNAVEKFLDMLNSSEKLRFFLAKHPFPKTDLQISIMFVNKTTDQFFSDGTICSTANINDKIYYRTQNVFEGRLVPFLEEPYENAKQIVKTHPLPYDMRNHKDQGFENELDKVCVDFARKVHKKYGIKCEDFGGKLTNGIEEIDFAFISTKKAPLEKARKLEVEITQMLLDTVNSNPKLKPYIKEYPLKPQNTPIRIHFKTKKEGFLKEGSISRMFQKDGRIHYFKEKPPTEWVTHWTDGDPVLDEPFTEAIEKLQKK